MEEDFGMQANGKLFS